MAAILRASMLLRSATGVASAKRPQVSPLLKEAMPPGVPAHRADASQLAHCPRCRPWRPWRPAPCGLRA